MGTTTILAPFFHDLNFSGPQKKSLHGYIVKKLLLPEQNCQARFFFFNLRRATKKMSFVTFYKKFATERKPVGAFFHQGEEFICLKVSFETLHRIFCTPRYL